MKQRCSRCGFEFVVLEKHLSESGPHIKITHDCGTYIKFARQKSGSATPENIERERELFEKAVEPPFEPTDDDVEELPW